MQDLSGWQAMLRELYGPGVETDGLIDFLETGRPEAPERPHSEDPVLRSVWLAERSAYRELTTTWRRLLASDVEGFLKILGAFPGTVLDRAAELHFRFPSSDSWPISSVVTLTNVSLFVRADLAQARYGHSAVDIVAEMFGVNETKRRSWSRNAYSTLEHSDAYEWLRQNVELIGPLLTVDAPNPTAAWRVFERATDEKIALFVTELVDAATGRLKMLRNQVRPITRKAGYDMLEAPLRTTAMVGSAPERLEALRLLRDLVPAERTVELVEWATEQMAVDRSNAVRAEIEILKETPISPSPVADQIACEVPIPAELTGIIRPFQAEWLASGGYINSTSREVLAVLIDEENSELRQQLAMVHIIRIVCAVPANDPNDRQNLQRFVMGVRCFPSLAQIEAVVRHDSPSLGFSNVVSRVVRLAAQPWIGRFWTDEDIAEWINSHLTEIGDHVRDPKLARRVLGLYDFVVPYQSILPAWFGELLVDGAINGPKRFREARQRAYSENVTRRIVPFLNAPRASTRLSAAEWLEDLGDPACIDAIMNAIEVERSEPVRAALNRLADQFEGRSVQSLQQIEAEARATRQGNWCLPKSISWLDFGEIPKLQSVDGFEIERGTVEWIIASAVKTNDIRPSATVVDFVQHVELHHAHLLGDFLLDRWLTEDQRTHTIEEARTLAEEKRVIRGIALTTYRDLDEVMTEILSKPSGTALPTKGLLSVVAACSAPNAGRRVGEFIDHWGISLRKRQCIALIEMLGWLDSPAAVRTVLDIAQGHWLASLQNQAISSARLIAERENWDEQTLQDYLAEKGELNHDGVLILDSASNSFQAELLPDLELRVTDRVNGALVRTIPEEMVKPWALTVSYASRQRLAKTRRAVRRSVKRERDRLTNAHASGRHFDGNHFVSAILDHPILRLLAAEYTWQLADSSTTFQVLPDRSLHSPDGQLVDPSGHTILCCGTASRPDESCL